MYGYLCVEGGFILSQELNSCSTDLRAQIGGVEGRCLQVGDQLQTANDPILRSEIGVAPIPLKHTIHALPSSEYQAFNENLNIIGGEVNGRCKAAVIAWAIVSRTKN